MPVLEFDAAFGQHGLQLLESVRGPVVAIVPEEQDPEGKPGVRV